jgi:hypothetical protein
MGVTMGCGLCPLLPKDSVGSLSTAWGLSAILRQVQTTFKIQTQVFRLSMILKVALPCQPAR